MEGSSGDLDSLLQPKNNTSLRMLGKSEETPPEHDFSFSGDRKEYRIQTSDESSCAKSLAMLASPASVPIPMPVSMPLSVPVSMPSASIEKETNVKNNVESPASAPKPAKPCKRPKLETRIIENPLFEFVTDEDDFTEFLESIGGQQVKRGTPPNSSLLFVASEHFDNSPIKDNEHRALLKGYQLVSICTLEELFPPLPTTHHRELDDLHHFWATLEQSGLFYLLPKGDDGTGTKRDVRHRARVEKAEKK